jgi:hypothetical protein
MDYRRHYSMNWLSKKNFFIIAACLAYFCSSTFSNPQQPSYASPQQPMMQIKKVDIEIAHRSLQHYIRTIITEENYMRFGFESYGEAQRAQLGEPYWVMIIGLKDLKSYQQGTGTKGLLIDIKTIWFPVMVKGEVRTKMEMVNKGGRWIAGEFGRIKIVKEIISTKNKLPELLRSKGIERPYSITLLKIPALYAVFFHIDSSRGEFLVPAMIQPQRYNIRNAEIYSADEMLVKLKEFAQKIDEKKVG